MTDETTHDPDGVLPDDLHGARAAAWAEHQQRCTDNEPYTDGVTVESLTERVERFAAGTAQLRRSGQDYAPAVSGHERPRPDDDSLEGADDDLEREWPWVDVLPRGDRRMFAEEMSQLMAEAAETDDLAPVEQALREWRVTSLTYSDPGLAQLFTGPRTANGERVPKPVV